MSKKLEKPQLRSEKDARLSKHMSLKIESKHDKLLHKFSTIGDCKELAKVLDSGRVHVDCADEEGTTPLMLASAYGHLDCVTLLIEEGAEVNAQRNTGTTALFFAAQGGNYDTVKYLLNQRAAVNLLSNDGGSPLFVAAQCGFLPIAELLVKYGAQIDTIMIDGATPLFIASQNGHLPLVRFLISKGANVLHRRNDGSSSLWIASQCGNASCVHELLKRGADIDCAREDGHTDVVEELFRHKPRLGILKNGESALHAACLFGHLPVARLLINHGTVPLLRNKAGETPMELAKQMGYDEIVNFLSKHQATESSV